jgi:antitoxin ParD1/3/4
MPIVLSPETERAIDEKLRSGAYDTADELIESALAALESLEDFRVADMEALRRQLRIGREQLERGQFMDGEEAFARLRAMRRDKSG